MIRLNSFLHDASHTQKKTTNTHDAIYLCGGNLWKGCFVCYWCRILKDDACIRDHVGSVDEFIKYGKIDVLQ